MKVGVFYPSRIPLSGRSYIDNISTELIKKKVDVLFFSEDQEIPPSADVYWDPRAMGGGIPCRRLTRIKKPLVTTIHGAASYALPMIENYSSIRKALIGKFYNKKNLLEWYFLKEKCTLFIAVSNFGKSEIAEFLSLDKNKIDVAWHGVNLSLFKPNSLSAQSKEPFFFHISQYQPVKNIDRIIEAYSTLEVCNKPSLLILSPGYPISKSLPSGVEIIRTPRSQDEVADLYRDALALVFCSLRESFGMPILEAMASGCPVITSNNSACAEVVGEAGLKVNPRSVNDIAKAMNAIILDVSMREGLRKKGLERAKCFTWERSANTHLAVFAQAIKQYN